MFWDKKEEKKALPDLPPLESPFNKNLSAPSEQDEDLQTGEKHALPSFPDSPINKGFSQAAIKDAVGSSTIKDDLETTGSPLPTEKEFKTIEMEEAKASSPSIASMQKAISSEKFRQSPIPEITENTLNGSNIMRSPIQVQSTQISPPPLPNISSLIERKPEKNSDIFVKIEKFQTARRALQTTHNHLEQIESILKKIRETKLKEEQELTAWEKDLVLAKSHIQEVTENIFEKLD